MPKEKDKKEKKEKKLWEGLSKEVSGVAKWTGDKSGTTEEEEEEKEEEE